MDQRVGLLWCAVWLSACGGKVADSTNPVASSSGGTATGGHASGGDRGTGGAVASGGGETGGIGDAGVDAPALPECPAELPWNTPCGDEGYACTSSYTDPSGPAGLTYCRDLGQCVNGFWGRTKTCRDDARCPSVAPTKGSPCSDVGLTCKYGESREGGWECFWCDGGCPAVLIADCEYRDGICCDRVGCSGSAYCNAEGRWQPARDGGSILGCIT